MGAALRLRGLLTLLFINRDGNDFAVVHVDNFLCETCVLVLVGDHDDRLSGAMEILEDSHYGSRRFIIKICGWLIREEKLRLMRNCASY